MEQNLIDSMTVAGKFCGRAGADKVIRVHAIYQNPCFPMQQTRLTLTTRKPEAFHIGSILDPQLEEEGVSTVLFETPDDSGIWSYSIYVMQNDADHWKAYIRDRLGQDCFGLAIEEESVADIDWVSETLRELTAVTAGRFVVHGSHDRQSASSRQISVEIDAGQAFGTGHHGTTAGCLDMLEICLRAGSGWSGMPRRALDVGSGSGVLAIALAKAAHIPVLATDIDPVAVHTARQNCVANQVAGHVHCETANGFQHPVFNRFGAVDLVFANILARPLEALARPMRPHLSPGAQVILSGLLPHQRARITSAYRRQNLTLQRWIIRDGWLTMLMKAS
jgi:ribosomal protein L11 methyltransferase